MKKREILGKIWKYCRIILVDFVITIFLFSLVAALNLIFRALPLGFSEERIALLSTITFWYSVSLMLIFPPFAIIEIIFERSKELKSND